jgi:signal transduction histidine kinase
VTASPLAEGVGAGGAPRRSVHVLVVEDSPDHRMLIVRALRGAGYEVSTAGTGEQALERLERTAFDVVLIDQGLPRMSGGELLRHVVDRSDAPAAVMVTAAGSQQLVVDALRLGAVDYVVKSSEYLGELPAVVARAHRQHDLARRYRELQRFALLVHEPTVREDVVDQIVTTAQRLLRGRGVALARGGERGQWDLAASSGHVDEPGSLLRWLDARDRGHPLPPSTDVIVDLPVEEGEPPGALVLIPDPEAPLLDEELRLAATFAAFAASALRQVRRLELERGLVDQLQQSVRAREDFVASVSHELRTPLTVITGYTETLVHRATSIPTSLQTDLLERVLGNAGELRRLIDQLLDVAALERGRELTPTPDEVDLGELVARVVEEVAFHLEGRPGDREVPSTRVHADPELIRRTLLNLVTNACKYSDPGTPVGIALVPDTDTVRVEVSDRGIGVAPEDRQRIFEPFWRGPTAVADAIRGTGIGLALVREYVDALGGEVGVEDTPGGGSTFWFTVPTRPLRPVVTEAEVGAAGEPGSRMQRPHADT